MAPRAPPTNRLLRRNRQRKLRADYNPQATSLLLTFMDDQASKENPPADFNKIDLSQLQGFNFGTQWTQDKSGVGSDRRSGDRPGREDRRDFAGPDRRDRRAFRRPAPGPEGAGAPGDAPPREGREFRGAPGGGDRRPRQGGGEFRGGPRRDFGGPGRSEPVQRGPYESPFFAAVFYPEDTSFANLAKTIRSSCRTIELFEIAKTVIGKVDRFIVVLTRKNAPGAAPAAEPAAAADRAAPKANPIYLSVPDGLPFESEEAAIAHVLATHRAQFFDSAEVEVDPPKGNFQVVNRCGVTGALLGPPNYHRYNQIVQQHFATRVSRMSLEAFRSRIESVREPELIQQWLEGMKKTTRYTWKLTPPPEGETPPVFDSLDEARYYLLANARDKVVHAADQARFPAKLVENLPPGEIRRAVEGAIERQRRFPLDTANALRGRLRREGFTIFKKGSKGISYVCAVKRKFRTPDQTFSDSIGSLISFVEAHPMVRASELPVKFLGLTFPAAPKPGAPSAPAASAETPTSAETATPVESIAPAETAPPVDSPAPADSSAAAETSAVAAPSAPEAAAVPELTVEQREKIARLSGDLRWLVTEGYVTEFIDGRLFAAPPMVEARKKEIERDEHDPENFPDAPAEAVASTKSAAASAAPAPVESAPEEPASAAPETAAPASDSATEPVAPASDPAAVVEPAPAPETSAAPAPETSAAPASPSEESVAAPAPTPISAPAATPAPAETPREAPRPVVE